MTMKFFHLFYIISILSQICYSEGIPQNGIRSRRQIGSFPVWGQNYPQTQNGFGFGVQPQIPAGSNAGNNQYNPVSGYSGIFSGYAGGIQYGPSDGVYTLGQLNRNSYEYTREYTTPNYNGAFGNNNANNGYNNVFGNTGSGSWYGK